MKRNFLLELGLLASLPIPLVVMIIVGLLFASDNQDDSELVGENGDTNTVSETRSIAPEVAAIATLNAAPERTLTDVHIPLIFEQGDYFATSGVCASCHANLEDSAGNDISIDAQWRSTMMANSGRDPYWRAGLRREVLSNPDFSDFIQDKCATCHMPMARTTNKFDTVDPETGEHVYFNVFGENGAADPAHPLHNLAIDSISCTECHQIQDVNLGEYESFSGNYSIDDETPAGERIAYGPFEPIETHTELMQNASGFIQEKGEHIQTSEMCASCHELFTPYFDVDTREVSSIEFPEQTPYSEWLHSDFKDQESCQDCHMPEVDGEAFIANQGEGLETRPNVSQHIFVGGNAYMMRIFMAFGDELAVTADKEHFETTLEATRHQLQNDTANVSFSELSIEDNTLNAHVNIESLTGHKMPASYPSRRAWLHFRVTDATGQVIFDSGNYHDDGSIIGNDNDEDPMLYEPHYEEITSDDQVQIYEPVLGDTAGDVTTVLLLASQYLKDNRILPPGFDKQTAPEHIAVHGTAYDDADFVGGGDQIMYRVPLGEAVAPFTVEAELLYQTISYRWAMNLKEYEDPEIAPEIVEFLHYYESVPNIPEQIGMASQEIDGNVATR